ncbi:hypothetical protein LTR36_000284 [Oleoguttula mirabilis]|uniref:NAD(P)-binding protein n=1 Tax=Oleoguttula mirabilis TaxID=1507867 RepID=A0AAV9JYB3_9PEZI|nr:hypothetical protein LTR36_000284 [Oleoguttula mirabilis]
MGLEKGVPTSGPLLAALATVGGLWTSFQMYNLASFIYLHFVRRSSLDRYKQSGSQGPAWALVTGASDGIGRGFAEELCHRGFNVIIHGRNEKKLQGVKDALLQQWPQREIRLLIIDAADGRGAISEIEAAATQLQDVNIRVLINNVGGTAGMPSFLTLEERSASDVAKFIDLNAQFPTLITRALLPLLIKCKPALILNMGSASSEIPAPWTTVYSGSKAYNKAWSRSLGAEMKAEGHDIEVICILLGVTATAMMQKKTSLMIPSSRQMAKSSLDVVGCGRSEVWAYWPHAVQFGPVLNLPQSVIEKISIGALRNEKAADEAKLKDC